jgi:hypothetical protein
MNRRDASSRVDEGAGKESSDDSQAALMVRSLVSSGCCVGHTIARFSNVRKTQ